MRSAGCEPSLAYFGQLLTRTLGPESRDVRYVKKIKSHKPKKRWNLMKYPQGLSRLLVGTDLFSSKGDEYLLICDHYSPNFPSSGKSQVDSPQKKTVVNLTGCVLFEQGVPEVIISDNGPQYHCRSCKQFTEEWGFQHRTFSPKYPKSNAWIY